MKNLLLIPLLFLLSLYLNNGRKITSKLMLIEQSVVIDSVIFRMDQPNFKATLREVNFAVKGSANGKTLFQRLGSIQYIISQLYKSHSVVFENNFHIRKHYKININWSPKTNFNAVRSKVLQKMKKILGYTIKTDMVNQKVYRLLVVDASKLGNAHIIPGGVKENFSSEVSNGTWNIVATLPKFAEALSNITKWRIQANQKKSLFYHFKLNVQKGNNELKEQLKQKYGLALMGSMQPVEQIKISFDKK